MNGVGRAQLTFQMSTLLKIYMCVYIHIYASIIYDVPLLCILFIISFPPFPCAINNYIPYLCWYIYSYPQEYTVWLIFPISRKVILMVLGQYQASLEIQMNLWHYMNLIRLYYSHNNIHTIRVDIILYNTVYRDGCRQLRLMTHMVFKRDRPGAKNSHQPPIPFPQMEFMVMRYSVRDI